MPRRYTRNVEERRHKVHFSYWLHQGVWSYRFIDTGMAALGPVRHTHDANVIRGLAERGGGLYDSEARLMMNYGIDQGKGGLYLLLTEEQYQRLK